MKYSFDRNTMVGNLKTVDELRAFLKFVENKIFWCRCDAEWAFWRKKGNACMKKLERLEKR